MPGAATPRDLAAMIDLVSDPLTHAERAAELEAKRVEAAEFRRHGQSALDRAGEMEANIDTAEASVVEREAAVERRQGEIKARQDLVAARELAVTERSKVVEARILGAFEGYAAIRRLIAVAFEDLHVEKL